MYAHLPHLPPRARQSIRFVMAACVPSHAARSGEGGYISDGLRTVRPFHPLLDIAVLLRSGLQCLAIPANKRCSRQSAKGHKRGSTHGRHSRHQKTAAASSDQCDPVLESVSRRWPLSCQIVQRGNGAIYTFGHRRNQHVLKAHHRAARVFHGRIAQMKAHAMARRNNEPDLDTDTGLPRKAVMKMVWKVAIVSLLMLQGGALWMGQRMIGQLDKAAADINEMKIQIARIELKLSLYPRVASTGKEVVPGP